MRVALITGGGSGIGLACARKFAESGDHVILAGRTEERLCRACESLPEGSDADWIAADVSKTEQCKSLVEETIRRAGRLDVLVNCAGVSKAGPSVEVTEEDWDRIIDTNLKGTFFTCRYAIPYLEKTGGNIVNISSDAGIVGNRELAAYCASKGGVTVMSRALALELAPSGVRVNCVCPTETDTDMLKQDIVEYGYGTREAYEEALQYLYPQKEKARFVKPEEVAEAVCFLADNRKAGAITGTEIRVDFGITAGY
ncbi:MAG: SDR family NAD(P)-dependent oxidoreductase [Eubacterium sp.]|nr:SDR family NAD(P)-dependent oxidoreductase [Eubacterium sp.]